MKKMNLQMLGLSVNGLLSREQMKKVMGGSGSGSGGSGCNITHGACAAPVVGAWDYVNPVCFSACQHDVWTYCSNQAGNCY